MEFICAACGRKHIREGSLVDEHIPCECGNSFYAFYNQGMTVTIPSDETRNMDVVMGFRRFVVTTGRCLDAPAEPVDYTEFLQRADPLFLMQAGLQKYQGERFRECLMNCGDIVSVFDSLYDGKDVLLKKKRDYIDIIEMKRKTKARGDPTFGGKRSPI